MKLQRMTVHGEPKHIILLQLSDDLQGTPAATKSGTAATIVIELERFPAEVRASSQCTGTRAQRS